MSQELRRVSLTNSKAQKEKIQVYSDWTLFLATVLLSTFCNLYGFIVYVAWFMFWVTFILDKQEHLNDKLLHAFWLHTALIYIGLQPLFIRSNVTHGLFWFLFPCCLVFVNDTAAYVCGRLFGRHHLLRLSPKKTLEGYLGAIILTVLFGYWFSSWLGQKSSLVDKKPDHIQFHGMMLSLFASIAAPFSGFLASAIKRASGVKDFGHWIPGHGGLTDRVDCHLFMAAFTYFYCKEYVYF
ncbi:Putative Phosphatidate cytidylyltransferase [Rhizopus microsporus]|nr:Putative Phosphatidate cytidylyltransferase [Rhizopus microsporus]